MCNSSSGFGAIKRIWPKSKDANYFETTANYQIVNNLIIPSFLTTHTCFFESTTNGVLINISSLAMNPTEFVPLSSFDFR